MESTQIMDNKTRLAMQQALEALDMSAMVFNLEYKPIALAQTKKAITALREALAEQVHTPYCKQAPMCKTPCGNSDCVEQAEQEPVAWLYDWDHEGEIVTGWVTQDFETTKFNNGHNVRPLYAAPVRTKDLTDDEIVDVMNKIYGSMWTEQDRDFARAVIAADREKNK